MAYHEYFNTFINNSATITEIAGENLSAPACKAVMYDADGNVKFASSGKNAVGLILNNAPEEIKKGESVDIIIKQIALAVAGGIFQKGDFLTVDVNGKVVAAQSGDFIFGRAFTNAAADGDFAQIQINQMGFME